MAWISEVGCGKREEESSPAFWSGMLGAVVSVGGAENGINKVLREEKNPSLVPAYCTEIPGGHLGSRCQLLS